MTTSTFAEHCVAGMDVVYERPPTVLPPEGLHQDFVAPGVEGIVCERAGELAQVRFKYATPSGARAYSQPLTVHAGQPCKIAGTPTYAFDANG